MILFFDINRLLKESNSNPIKLLQILREFNNPSKLMRNNLRNKLKGYSFLLKPDALLKDKGTDVSYIYQYIVLASKRDYTLYTLYGIKYLPLSHYPDINLDSIKTNPLLKITQTQITFKYEEV